MGPQDLVHIQERAHEARWDGACLIHRWKPASPREGGTTDRSGLQPAMQAVAYDLYLIAQVIDNLGQARRDQ